MAKKGVFSKKRVLGARHAWAMARIRKGIRRKYFGSNKISTTVVRSPSVVPDRTMCKLKYNEIVNLQDATYFAGYTFSGNGLYDVNITSTGTQPTGFDQYMALYQKYRVLGSKIKVKFGSTSSASTGTLAILPCLDYTGVISGGLNQVIRDPRCKYNTCAGNLSEVKTVKNYLTTKKAFGEIDIQDPDYEGTASANPSNQWYWVIAGANTIGSGGLELPLHIEIIYYVEFFKRKDLATS